MNKVYSRINWENEPSTKTPLNEHNLNKIDFAVDEIDNRVIELDATKAKNTDLQTLSTRVDNLILNAGDSSAECADARVTEDGTTYDTLKKRLDAEHSSVAEDISQLSNEIVEIVEIANNIEPYMLKGSSTVNVFDINASGLQNNKVVFMSSPTTYTYGANNGWMVSDFINISMLDKIYIDNYCANASYPHAVIFDINKNPLYSIKCVTNGDSCGLLDLANYPDGHYIQINSSMNKTNTAVYVNVDEKPVEFLPYNKAFLDWLYVSEDQIEKRENILTIKKDGTGDFSTLREAMESTNKTDTYVFQIYEGEYDVLADYSEEEINNAAYDRAHIRDSFCGVYIDGNITLRGVGNVVIKGELDRTLFSDHIRGNISTLNVQGNVKLENLTITSRNLRYAIHDDFIKSNTKMVHTNCKFINYAGVDGVKKNNAYGMGCASGKETEFNECYFEPNFYMHTNYNFLKPSKTTLKNCVCSDRITLDDMGSGKMDKVGIYGCVSPEIKYRWYNNNRQEPNIEIVCNTNTQIKHPTSNPMIAYTNGEIISE